MVFNVSLTTQRNRVDGRTVKSETSPLFSQEEEARLVSHIKEMGENCYDYFRAEIIRMTSDCAVFSLTRPKNKPLTNQSYYNFMRRWTDLNLVKPKALDVACARAATNKPESIYNIDEKGININYKPTNIVAARDSKPQAVTSGRSSTITIIAGGNALGTHIPLFYVFLDQQMREELLVDGTPARDGTEIFMKFIPARDAENQVLVIFSGHAS